MTATLDDVTKRKPEPSAEQLAADELVRQAREQGLSLTGPGGLLKQLTRTVLETALNQEMTGHLGHEKNARLAGGSGNVRNGILSGSRTRLSVLTWGFYAARSYSLMRPVPCQNPACRPDLLVYTQRSCLSASSTC